MKNNSIKLKVIATVKGAVSAIIEKDFTITYEEFIVITEFLKKVDTNEEKIETEIN